MLLLSHFVEFSDGAVDRKSMMFSGSIVIMPSGMIQYSSNAWKSLARQDTTEMDERGYRAGTNYRPASTGVYRRWQLWQWVWLSSVDWQARWAAARPSAGFPLRLCRSNAASADMEVSTGLSKSNHIKFICHKREYENNSKKTQWYMTGTDRQGSCHNLFVNLTSSASSFTLTPRCISLLNQYYTLGTSVAKSHYHYLLFVLIMRQKQVSYHKQIERQHLCRNIFRRRQRARSTQ